MAESTGADQREIAEALATADLAPRRHREKTFNAAGRPARLTAASLAVGE
jgi:hypothetical protein